MHNFLRIVKIAFTHKWTIFLSFICALGIGLMWGGNIAPIYPFIEVLVKGRSMHQWIDSEIETCNESIANIQGKISALEAEKNPQNDKEIKSLTLELDSQKKKLAWREYFSPVIKKRLPDSAFKMSIVLAGVIIIGSLIKGIFLISQNLLVARITQRTILELRKIFFVRALQMDQSAFLNGGAADLMSRFTNDVSAVMSGLNILFGKMVREPLKLICCLIGAALVSWRLLMACFIILPAAGVAISWLAKALKRSNRKAMEEMAQIYRSLDETFSGMEVIQAFTMERFERHQFFQNCKNYLRKAMKIAMYDSLNQPLTELISLVIVSIAIILGAHLTLTGATHLFGIRMAYTPLEPTQLLLFFAFLVGAADPARKMADIFTSLQNACAAADRIYEKIDQPIKIHQVDHPQEIATLNSSIEFRNLNFSYTPGVPILKDVNLTINRGETVAFVGLNGCGKSTLLKMIPRFLDPDSGEVLIDGVNLKQLRLRSWRELMSLVPQNPLLFDDTVRNNIAHGKPNATEEQIRQAAQAAMADDFIERDLSNGYDTVVGPRGSALSGGQRQRIALARAIVRQPQVFLLDEATREIDLKSEIVIRQSLMNFAQGRTTVFVTHDMALLSIANKIVMMEEGRIIDVGTHVELMERCPQYRALNEIQFSRKL